MYVFQCSWSHCWLHWAHLRHINWIALSLYAYILIYIFEGCICFWHIFVNNVWSSCCGWLYFGRCMQKCWVCLTTMCSIPGRVIDWQPYIYLQNCIIFLYSWPMYISEDWKVRCCHLVLILPCTQVSIQGIPLLLFQYQPLCIVTFWPQLNNFTSLNVDIPSL